MYEDNEWVDQFVKMNRDLLKESFDEINKFCEGKQWDVIVRKPEAGMFTVIDLRRYMKEETWEEEMKLWRIIFDKCQIVLNPGKFFGFSHPGFFRVCYGSQPIEVVLLAFEKLYKALESTLLSND